MDESDFGFDAVSISVAGIDYVENTLDVDEPRSFFQDMVFKRPKLTAQFGAWFDFVVTNSKEKPNIRDVAFNLLQQVLDKFTEVEENQSCKESVKRENGN